MKWAIIRSAIDRDIKESADPNGRNHCLRGGVDEGYRVSYEHDAYRDDIEAGSGDDPKEWMAHYILPPVGPSRAQVMHGTVYREDPQGRLEAYRADVWGEGAGAAGESRFQGLYRQWADRVDQIFYGWDNLPDERRFWESATTIRDAVRPLGALDAAGGAYYAVCSFLGLLETSADTHGSEPRARIHAPQIDSVVDYFVIPLQGILYSICVLGEHLAAHLQGLGDMWHQARIDVMEIGFHGAAKMSGDGGEIDPGTLVKAAGWVVGALGLLAMPAMAGISLAAVGLVLSAAQEVFEGKKKATSSAGDFAQRIEGETAREVLDSIDALINLPGDSLNQAIKLDETDSAIVLEAAAKAVASGHSTEHKGEYTIRFTVDKGAIVGGVAVDGSPGADIEVDSFPALRNAGITLADDISAVLSKVSREVQDGFLGRGGWFRPVRETGVIGGGEDGPFAEWSAVHTQCVEVIGELSGQVVAAGELLISAANFLERQDESAEETLKAAAAKVGIAFGP